jgi:PAS domain S-box-containing protein
MSENEGVWMEIDFCGVVNALPGLVWTTRDDGDCYFVNQAWRNYTGLDQHEALNHGWKVVIHPEDRTCLLETWEGIRRSGDAKEIYVRLRRFDAEYRWFTVRPSRGPQGIGVDQHWCWLGMDADEGPTTDGRLRRIFDMLPIQAAFLNPQGTSEFSNRQVLQDYNMSLEELAAWQTSGAIHPDDHPVVYEQLTRLMTTGEMFDATLRMRYRDGGYRWMRCRCVPCRDAQGNIARYVTVQSDVHDLKHAEDLLAAEVKLLEQVARGDSLGRVLDALSRSFESLCDGWSCGVFLIASDRKHFQFEAELSVLPGNKEFLSSMTVDAGDTPYSLALIEKAMVVTSDSSIDQRWEGTPWRVIMEGLGFRSCCAMPIVSASGAASGVVAIHRASPVTPTEQQKGLIDRFAKIAGIAIARAHADEALHRARSELAHVARVATLNAMTASIAHEVSQPISGILTNANTCVRMLAGDPPNLAGVAETTRRTIRDANRAADVIKRLRAMFSNKVSTRERCDLNEVAQEVIGLLRTELQRSRAHLQTDFAADLPFVIGDRVQVQQVIVNLLLNAADAMAGIEDRPRTLLVQTRLHEDGSAMLSVRDSGIGVDPYAAERLFEAFYTTKEQGLGVGLSISRSIIESHRGRLWATANDGPGATFSFSIPGAARA